MTTPCCVHLPAHTTLHPIFILYQLKKNVHNGTPQHQSAVSPQSCVPPCVVDPLPVKHMPTRSPNKRLSRRFCCSCAIWSFNSSNWRGQGGRWILTTCFTTQQHGLLFSSMSCHCTVPQSETVFSSLSRFELVFKSSVQQWSVCVTASQQ